MSEPSNLDLYTTNELIDELMRRTTFLGVVVQSEAEYRGNGWGAERIFRVHVTPNLETRQAIRLLDAIASHSDECGGS